MAQSPKPHWMTEHRTICDTLYEARKRFLYQHHDKRGVEIIDEAILYARKMSLKLTKYREQKVLDK